MAPSGIDQVHDEEMEEWLESLDSVLSKHGPKRVREILQKLYKEAKVHGVNMDVNASGGPTPYINTIPLTAQPAYPGDGHLEWRIRSLIRWNAMAMVVRANHQEDGIGGHISSYASAATLLEVGFNHFFRGRKSQWNRDLVYFQGHCSPGIYARAYLEGRLSAVQLENFRRELSPGGGLSSYPHPWLMPDFWEFPTVSMGLGPICAIYQARFMRYLENRGHKPPSDAKVWAFLGDGETDEPESLGAIRVAGRENLDNLIFVINCNLQRLDGPVRGNGKIIQELETSFAGAGWNVIKVVWGGDWDPILERDQAGLLKQRMGEAVDGEFQKYIVESGAYIREHFFGKHPALLKLVEDIPDDKLRRLRRGGHDPDKVYAAYQAAVAHKGGPTVILAKTIKGYGLGESGEGKNITHQQKKLNEDELMEFRGRYGIPISDEEVALAPFYKPGKESAEIKYLMERRAALGGPVPTRGVTAPPLKTPDESFYEEFYKGTEGREVSTTMVFVRILAKLLKDPELSRLVVPIVPDEARTFGMETLFRQCGIYSPVGQLYEPVDMENLLYYREAVDGQILEEGITEAGALSSFIAAGTAPATWGINTIPFFIFYSMFGMQRVGDSVWAAADSRCKGFLLGATAGRTTLAGEGLQHQDGQSHLLALPVPNLRAYDPAFAYELAVIIQDGLTRMYQKQEDIFYYLTVMNENYAMPVMPAGSKDGILKGMYLFQDGKVRQRGPKANLLASGAIVNEALRARKLLEEEYGVSTAVWSMTSIKALLEDAQEIERWNRLHPGQPPQVPYVTNCLEGTAHVTVAATDYVRALPDSLGRFIPQPYTTLGTDGFGRSEARKDLRDFFEVDWRHIAVAALSALSRQGKVRLSRVAHAIRTLGLDPDRINPYLR